MAEQTESLQEQAKPKKRSETVKSFRERREKVGKSNRFEFDKACNTLKPLIEEGEEVVYLANFLQSTGVVNFEGAQHLVFKLLNSLPKSTDSGELLTQIMAVLHEINPQDPIEGMLACQMIATFNLSMDCTGRAMASGQTFEGRELNLKHVEKLMRVYREQMEAMAKYRNKGQQTIQVQHVNVGEGGQAIVGNVTPLGAGQK